MWGVVLHMVALYVMGTCMSGVQLTKEGEYVGCGFTHGGAVCDGGPVCLGYKQQRKVSVGCGFTHGGAVCDGDPCIWGTTSKGR